MDNLYLTGRLSAKSSGSIGCVSDQGANKLFSEEPIDPHATLQATAH